MAFITVTPVVSRSAATTLAPRSQRPQRPSRRPSAAPRMIATESVSESVASTTTTKTVLSDRAVQLLAYIRGHKSIFSPGEGFMATHLALFRKNDTGRSFTPLDELATNAHMLPGGSVAAMMLVQQDDLIAKGIEIAKTLVPNLAADDVLTEILEYDIRTILRTISYGAACHSVNFIHENNMGMMKMLHQEIGIPDGTVTKVLSSLKDIVVSQISDDVLVAPTSDCFDAVGDFMA